MNVVDLFTPDPNRPQAGAPEKPYKWLVIDGGGLAVTSWATHKDLDRPEDRVRASIYVFIACLASLSRMTDAEAKIIICWDGYDNRRWRRGAHPWYKHGRGSVIDRNEVRVVIQRLEELLECMGIARLKIDGREADDIIATVTRELAEQGERSLIFSDDKDFIQLVGPLIHLCRRSMQGIVMTPSQCRMLGLDYGERALHVKAMMGDYGDNIKGLLGIGERKAQQALDVVPDLLVQCAEDPVLADWEDLPKVLHRAFVRAGRKLVSPVPMRDKTFARDFAIKRGMMVPLEYDVPEEVSLRAAGLEAIRCLSLVELDDTVDYGELRFPEVNVERIPTVLRKLDMQNETDLLSSIYVLARMRNPDVTPPRTASVRAGSAVRDDEIMPEDMF